MRSVYRTIASFVSMDRTLTWNLECYSGTFAYRFARLEVPNTHYYII